MKCDQHICTVTSVLLQWMRGQPQTVNVECFCICWCRWWSECMMPALRQVRHCRGVIDLLQLYQCICNSAIRCSGYPHYVHQASVVILPRTFKIHLEQ